MECLLLLQPVGVDHVRSWCCEVLNSRVWLLDVCLSDFDWLLLWECSVVDFKSPKFLALALHDTSRKQPPETRSSKTYRISPTFSDKKLLLPKDGSNVKGGCTYQLMGEALSESAVWDERRGIALLWGI